MRTRSTAAAIVSVGLLTTAVLLANALPGPAADQLINRSRNGLAIDGYDPVAYFADGNRSRETLRSHTR